MAAIICEKGWTATATVTSDAGSHAAPLLLDLVTYTKARAQHVKIDAFERPAPSAALPVLLLLAKQSTISTTIACLHHAMIASCRALLFAGHEQGQ